jgi:hypothetical protein
MPDIKKVEDPSPTMKEVGLEASTLLGHIQGVQSARFINM